MQNITDGVKNIKIPSISITSSHWLGLVAGRGGTFFIRMSVNIVG